MLVLGLLKVQAGASIMMLLLWLWQEKTKDATAVDVAWALGIGMATLWWFFELGRFDLRHSLIAAVGVFWSMRLGGYLWLRMLRLTDEDSRYQTMRQAMGRYASVGYLGFFQLQAIFITLFSMPIFIALSTESVQLMVTDFVGFGIFAVAVIGEGVADRQLMRFKALNPGRDKTCQVGLWRYSRHPNYFFEWLHWFAYAAFSVSSPLFLVTCIMPFAMLIFLLKLTGIPHVENEALKSKKDYQEYMNSTSGFIPWFRKNK